MRLQRWSWWTLSFLLVWAVWAQASGFPGGVGGGGAPSCAELNTTADTCSVTWDTAQGFRAAPLTNTGIYVQNGAGLGIVIKSGNINDTHAPLVFQTSSGQIRAFIN